MKNDIIDRKVAFIDCRDSDSRIVWLTLADIDRDEPHKAHQYNAIGPDCIIGRLDGFEAFCHPTIVDYAYRGGWRSHLAISKQQGGFATLAEAQADAAIWLKAKSAERLAKAVKRKAKQALAAAACLLAVLVAPQADASSTEFYVGEFAGDDCGELTARIQPESWDRLIGDTEDAPTAEPKSFWELAGMIGKATMVGATAGDGIMNAYYANEALIRTWQAKGCEGEAPQGRVGK